MPIFEYTCHDCRSEFEALVRSSTVPQCPHCASTRLDKKLSTFAAIGSQPEPVPPMGACGSCGHPDGPGACALH